MSLEELIAEAHANAQAKGFWEEANLGEKLCLIHSEVSEVLEHYRKGTAHEPSSKIPAFTNEEEELADIVLRILDLAGHRKVRLVSAMEAKHAYNVTRPYKHGRKF